METNSQYVLYAVAIAVVVLAGMAFALGANSYGLGHRSSATAPQDRAALNVTVTSSAGMVSSLTVGLHGNGINMSAAVVLGPDQQDPIAAHVLFADLNPDTSYHLTLNGSARPYCAPGQVCPMFIVAVHSSENVRTGPSGSVTSAIISAFGSANYSGYGNLAPCSNVSSLGNITTVNGTRMFYERCGDWQRMLNFVPVSVNKNGTVTGLYYPYLPVVRLNDTPVVKTVSPGEEAGYTCNGYAAYLNSTDYAAQYSVFRVVVGRPIPCPV